jgi:hypothetical protein
MTLIIALVLMVPLLMGIASLLVFQLSIIVDNTTTIESHEKIVVKKYYRNAGKV